MSDAVDDTITFDEQGVCNYCTDALAIMPAMYFPNDEGKRRLEALVAVSYTHRDVYKRQGSVYGSSF